ncbi:MAG: hypothetical protein FWD48_09945 [Oscillospiraceae bacterium]|nr:hypothetical protein [Oscillospiraceae bacterium]
MFGFNGKHYGGFAALCFPTLTTASIPSMVDMARAAALPPYAYVEIVHIGIIL